MKLGFVIPLMTDYDVEKAFHNIEKACFDCKVDFEVIFAINANLNSVFTKVRGLIVDNNKIKAFMVQNGMNEHQLITIAMEKCEQYDAIVIYSGKEEINIDVVRAFVTSWQAGNKIVYLKKVYTGLKKIGASIKNFFYLAGLKFVGIYKDYLAENDIQLLDKDVVITINQLPAKNQQLRTLDSFVGYHVDMVHMEVNSKKKEDSAYAATSKSYLTSKVLSMLFLCLTVIGLIVGILAYCLNWHFPVGVHIGLILLFIVSAVLAFLFNAKRTLALRVGHTIDVAMLENAKEKLERYNF